MACSKYASTKQTTNAARVSRLLLDPCTDMLRDVLRNYIPETSFPGKLQSQMLTIKPLLNASQRVMLYPQQGTFTGSYPDFDISLLYLLLRNIAGINQHTKGWGKNPIPGDRSISANIERIRNIRNTYIGHMNQSSMSDSQFNSVWQDVRNIASELVKDVGLTTDYVGLIDRLEHEPMDPEQEQAYLQKLDDTELTLADLKEEQAAIKKTQQRQYLQFKGFNKSRMKETQKIKEEQAALKKTQQRQSVLLKIFNKSRVKEILGIKDKQERQGEVQRKQGSTLVEHENKLREQGNTQAKHGATLARQEEIIREQGHVLEQMGTAMDIHESLITEQKTLQAIHCADLQMLKEAQNQEAKNILDNTEAVLQNHKSSGTYVKTGQVETVKQKLCEKHFVLLTGIAGDGKSTIAKQVLCELHEDKEYVPVILREPCQWDKVVNPNQNMAVSIDDMFGASNVDTGAVEKWKKVFDRIMSAANKGNVLVLISSRKNILAEIRKSCHESFMNPEYEIDLTSNVVTSKEKERMLLQCKNVHIYKASDLTGDEFRKYEEQHGKDAVYKLSKWQREDIVWSKPYYGFPQSCFLFFARKDFFQLGNNFFLRANKTLFQNIDNMRKSTDIRIKMQYCTLAYIFLEGNVHLLNLKEDIFQEICEKSSLPKLTEVDVEDAVQDLEGIYLSPSNQTHVLTFCHVTIREAVAASFGKLAPDIVIQKCSREILRELIRTEGYVARDGEVILTIRKRYYPLLANRLLTEDTRYMYRLAVDHPATDDAEFTAVLFDEINKSPHNSRTIIKGILDKLKFVDKPVLYREILTRHGPHHIKHKAEYDSDVTVDEHDSDTSVEFENDSNVSVDEHDNDTPAERPYLITCEQVKSRLDDHLYWGHKQTVVVIIRYVISNCDVNYFLNSYNVCGILGMSVLHCCVAQGWTDVVDEILNNVTPTKTENNWSCLHIAAVFGRLELFKKFEKLSFNVLENTREGYNILQVVLLGLRVGMCRPEFEKCYLSVSDSDDNCVYFSDISEHEADFVSILQHVMTRYPSLITSIDMPLDRYNNNIIHYIVIHDRQEICDMLVNKKKDLILRWNNTELPTTLHVATYLGRVKFVEKLWKAGVRAEMADLSIAKYIESGQEYSDRIVTYQYSYETGMNQWRDQRRRVLHNIKLKCIRDQPVRFGCSEDYTAISSICIADN